MAPQPARVLVVDDEVGARRLLEVMLAPEGFIVTTSESGEEALSLVARQPFHLVLLDVMMPGMNGYQVARKLKGTVATKDIPVILVTSLSDPHDMMLGLKAGAEGFVTKPVNRAELCSRVHSLLGPTA